MCFGVWGRVELRLRLDLFCSEEGERQDATRFLEGGHEYLSGAFMLVEYRGVSVGAWWCDIGQQGQDDEPIWAQARQRMAFSVADFHPSGATPSGEVGKGYHPLSTIGIAKQRALDERGFIILAL